MRKGFFMNQSKFPKIPILALFITCLVGNGNADWPTTGPFGVTSGNLPRPVLFVHGINSDMTTWGAYPKPDSDKWNPYRLGMVSGPFEPRSAPEEMRILFHMTLCDDPDIYAYPMNNFNCDINHQGLEFYSSMAFRQNGTISGLDPFATIEMTDGVVFDVARGKYQKGQPNQLNDKLTTVLDEYFSDWRTNMNREIDLVCHSQGCLVVRNLIRSSRNADLSNPVNHIHSIVSVNSPAIGTAMAGDGSGLSSVQRVRRIVFALYDGGYLNSMNVPIPGTFSKVPVDPFREIRHILESFISRQSELAYPSNFQKTGWVPNSIIGREGTLLSSGTMRSTLDAPLTKPINNSKIPLTALSGTTPGLGVALGNFALQQGQIACNSSHFGVIIDDISWWQGPILGAALGTIQVGGLVVLPKPKTCSEWVTYVHTYLSSVFIDLDTEWSGNSDFVVDLSSQEYFGKFNRFNHPFVAKRLVPFPGDLGVPHMTIPGVGANGNKLLGATLHGVEIANAVKNPPKQLLATGIPSFLLN